MEGGSWTFEKTDGGYVFVEHGALGKVGEGTATFSGNVVRMNFSSRAIGAKTIDVVVNGNQMSGVHQVFFMKIPFQAQRA